MTFMLGAFTQGLSDGAKDIYGLGQQAANIEAIKAHTRAVDEETARTKAAFDAGKTLAAGAQQAQPVPTTTTLATTPSDTGVAGGGPGTTTNGPVAPLNFDKAVPQPAYMPQSDPGSASGFGPSYNPEAGPVAAAAKSMPMPAAPTLANGADRTSPTGLGGAAAGAVQNAANAYSQSFKQPAPANAAVRPIVSTDPTQSNQAIPTNTAATAQPGQNVPVAAMPTYDITPQTTQPVQPGPNMGVVTNRPVGAALMDWIRGTKTPEQPMTHGKPAQDNVGRHLAGALSISR